MLGGVFVLYLFVMHAIIRREFHSDFSTTEALSRVAGLSRTGVSHSHGHLPVQGGVVDTTTDPTSGTSLLIGGVR